LAERQPQYFIITQGKAQAVIMDKLDPRKFAKRVKASFLGDRVITIVRSRFNFHFRSIALLSFGFIVLSEKSEPRTYETFYLF